MTLEKNVNRNIPDLSKIWRISWHQQPNPNCVIKNEIVKHVTRFLWDTYWYIIKLSPYLSWTFYLLFPCTCQSTIGIIYYCSFHISLSKAFWRLLFYYLLFLAETFMMCVNVFLYNQEQRFRLIRQKTNNFPKDPHGEISHFLSDPIEISFLVI